MAYLAATIVTDIDITYERSSSKTGLTSSVKRVGFTGAGKFFNPRKHLGAFHTITKLQEHIFRLSNPDKEDLIAYLQSAWNMLDLNLRSEKDHIYAIESCLAFLGLSPQKIDTTSAAPSSLTTAGFDLLVKELKLKAPTTNLKRVQDEQDQGNSADPKAPKPNVSKGIYYIRVFNI